MLEFDSKGLVAQNVLEWHKGVAESKLCQISLLHGVFMLFHFICRNHANGLVPPDLQA